MDLRASGAFTSSNYAFVVYRKACPGGGSAVLVAFTSLQSPSGVFPKINIIQGSAVRTNVPYTREPFTVREGIYPGREPVNLGEPVLLNATGIDYSGAMTIQFVESFLDGRTVTVDLPDFDPALYPAAIENLPIAGYVSGLYYNPATPGEGIQIEIDAATEGIVATWFTYGPDGRALWLFGNGAVCPTAICVFPPTYSEIELFAFQGGRFDSQFDPAALQNTKWGDLRVEWKTCGAITFTLSPTHSDPALPTASGERTWSRLTSIQGRGC